MTEPEIRQQVREFIVSNFLEGLNPSDLEDDSSFEALHLIDSVRALDVILFVEETFGIEVENEEALPENFDSIDNIVTYVLGKQGA